MWWFTDWLTVHIIEIYFVYGLGFFILGLMVLLESGHASALPLVRATPWLAGFGFVHASAEWFEMLVKIDELHTGVHAPFTLEAVGIGLEFISFMCLLRFGCELMLIRQPRPRCRPIVVPVVLAVFIGGLVFISLRLSITSVLWLRAVHVWVSYAAGLPAFFLTVRGLLAHRLTFVSSGMPGMARELTGAAIAFMWYAAFDSLFVPDVPYFPASVINAAVFINITGVPVQLFRAVNALVLSFFFFRVLRFFTAEDRRQLEEAVQAQRQLQAASEALNRELRDAAKEMSALYEQLRRSDEVHSHLLQRVVRAQEEERRRVARDLHDGVGQTLSGLAAGLAALRGRARSSRAYLQQMANMEKYASRAAEELHSVMSDLRPSLLDELGLVASLRWYAHHYTETLPLQVRVDVKGQVGRLPPDIEIILFRIAQEALTNIVRHARANEAHIELSLDQDSAVLKISDDGIGFEPAKVFAASGEARPWGILGMQERAALVGGSVDIESSAWKGTRVTAKIPLLADRLAWGNYASSTGG